jgi:hypothetical protein
MFYSNGIVKFRCLLGAVHFSGELKPFFYLVYELCSYMLEFLG